MHTIAAHNEPLHAALGHTVLPSFGFKPVIVPERLVADTLQISEKMKNGSSRLFSGLVAASCSILT